MLKRAVLNGYLTIWVVLNLFNRSFINLTNVGFFYGKISWKQQ